MLTSGSCLAMHAAALVIFFFFNDTATTEIYTLSLHDALPISRNLLPLRRRPGGSQRRLRRMPGDRKSTRLNSSHQAISYAVFCLKKNRNAVRIALHDQALSFCIVKTTTLRLLMLLLLFRLLVLLLLLVMLRRLFFLITTAPPESYPFPFPDPLRS